MTRAWLKPLAARSASGLRRGCSLLVALALGGCVVGPDYRDPLPLLLSATGDGKSAARRIELGKWWVRLGDPLLNALIREAVRGNLDVATAKAKIREARATYRQAVGALFPSIDGSASATRSRSAGSEGGTPTTYNQFQAGLDASWEIDLFGANRRAVEAAAYGIDASDQELRATLLTLIGDVATYYVQARGYQARIALARRTAASQKETAALTRSKFEAGAASAVDVANAAGQAASTEANIPALETSYREAVHRLSVLTGRAPTALTQELAKSRPIPSPRLPLPGKVPAIALLDRPDVRLAERQFAQYTARIGEAEAARYPSVTLTGSIATTATRVGDLGRGSTIGWSYGPSVTVPLFNGGQLRAAVEIAEAQRDQYFIAYKAAVLTALEDVENAVVALAQERIRSAKLTTSATHYRDAATLARSLFQAGSSSFLNLLEAERSLYSAEDDLLQSRVAIAVDYVALNKALGGGWTGYVDASEPEIIDVDTGPHFIDREASDARALKP